MNMFFEVVLIVDGSEDLKYNMSVIVDKILLISHLELNFIIQITHICPQMPLHKAHKPWIHSPICSSCSFVYSNGRDSSALTSMELCT